MGKFTYWGILMHPLLFPSNCAKESTEYCAIPRAVMALLCSVPTTLNNTSTQCYVSLRPGNNDSGTIVVAASVPYYNIWGAQLEPVTYQTTPSTYVATTSAAYYGPRFDYDPVTLAARGLLIEEQRTNLLTYSEQFDNAAWTKASATIAANATTAPDGTVSADKLNETAVTDTHYVYQTPTLSAITYTFSVYVKAAERTFAKINCFRGVEYSGFVNLTTGAITSLSGGATLTATSVGNGWWRCNLVFTVATGGGCDIGVLTAVSGSSANYAGSAGSGIFIWGAQLEAGAFATSYIPTVASQVTRTVDTALIQAPNFAPWYNQSAGTFVVSLTPRGVPVGGNNVRFLEVNDGTITSRNPLMYASSTGTTYTQYRVAGADQANLNSSTSYYAANSTITIGAAYAANDFATSFSGGAVQTDTSGSVVTNAIELDIGYARSAAGTEVFNGWMRSIRYYPTRLTNAQLQALTA